MRLRIAPDSTLQAGNSTRTFSTPPDLLRDLNLRHRAFNRRLAEKGFPVSTGQDVDLALGYPAMIHCGFDIVRTSAAT